VTDVSSEIVRGTTRRTLVRGAAWSVPVVAAATTAPAFAASPCGSSYTWKLDWGTTSYAKNGANLGTATVNNVTGTYPITVSFTSSVTGTFLNNIVRHSTNLNIEAGMKDIGALGINEQGLELWHQSSANSDSAYQTVQVHFDRSVSGLAFTITDIDFSLGNFSDRVAVSGNRIGTPASTYVIGSGTYGDPWRPRDSSPSPINMPDTGDNRGNVAVKFQAPVTDFEIRYWNRGGSGQQAVWIGDLTWSALGC
jgi:hypothetical protein